MLIQLKDPDLRYILDLAKKRNAKKAKFGSMTYGGKQGSRMAHFIGLAGEYVVAKSIGSEVDERIFENHGDDGIDLLDEKWGVKTTTYLSDPYLRVEMHHFNEEINGYVLCAYNPQSNLRKIEIVGWASKETVKQGKQVRLRTGGPMNYILTKDQLSPWPRTNEESRG